MGLLKKFSKFVGGMRLEWPLPYREGLPFSDITVRDPFIVKDGKGGYIMAGTIYHYNFNDSYGAVIYKSDDLKVWKGPFTILKKATLKPNTLISGRPKYTMPTVNTDFSSPFLQKAERGARICLPATLPTVIIRTA